MRVQRDSRGVPVTAGRVASLQHYDAALNQLLSYVGDPIATLDTALAEDPDFVSGYLMKALVLCTQGERKYLPAVEEALAAASARVHAAHERERVLMQVVRDLAGGEWHAACRLLDQVLIEHPRDVLALQVAHLFDFSRGDALNLRNRVTRVLPHWDISTPGYSYVLGMHAFGLEEMNQYAEAEAQARRALEIEPTDGWAVHAVAHVMEMQGRIDEGITWLESRESDWAPDNGFAFHNWWHLALFYLDDAHHDWVLTLFDRALHPEPSQLVLSLVDATALLWRLKLESVDVGSRFEALADEWEAQLDAEAGYYAFNDVHAAMAFAACDRGRSLDALKAAMSRATERENALTNMSREVGIPLVAAIESFARSNYRSAIERIEPVRDIANRFGGSHAQRDVITLTLIEACLQAGDLTRARHYLAERRVLKSKDSRWGLRLEGRAQDANAVVARLVAA